MSATEIGEIICRIGWGGLERQGKPGSQSVAHLKISTSQFNHHKKTELCNPNLEDTKNLK